MKQEPRTQHAFTLIETLIVMTILSVSLLIGTSLVITSLKAAEKNKNRFIATYLTQECLELARNMRDSAWKQNLPWDCAIPQITETGWVERRSSGSTSTCLTTFPVAGGIQAEINISSNPEEFVLWYENEGFSHVPSDPSNSKKSIFSRKLERHFYDTDANGSNDNDKAKISCNTSWTQDGETEQIEIFEILTDWK